MPSKTDWICPYCGESVPTDFEVCFRCGSDRSGRSIINLDPVPPPLPLHRRKFHPRMGLCVKSAMAAWFVTLACAIYINEVLGVDVDNWASWPNTMIAVATVGSIAFAIGAAATGAIIAFLISPLKFTWPDEPDSR